MASTSVLRFVGCKVLFGANCDIAANIFTCKTLSDPTWIKSGVPFETLPTARVRVRG